ncbi:MAG: hypothetical protein ACRD18_05080 [Terriglobia bacterium]
MQRYAGKMLPDDVASLTARQVNNVFGGLNQDVMGRGKTFQDFLRLALIAPDFEEGNARFAASMLTPKSAEARRAFALQSGQMYVAARMANAALNHGNTYPDKPFSVFHNGRECDIRSMPTDLLGLIKNPQTTLGYRQSPVATLGTELVTGRDQFGRPVSVPKAFETSIERVMPIAAQGPLGLGGARREPMTKKLAESVGTSVGVHDYPYRTPAEAKAQQAARAQLPLSALGASHKAPARVRNLPLLVKDVKQVPLSAALDAYRKASPQERLEIRPIITAKYYRQFGRALPEAREALRKAFQAAMASQPYGAASRALRGLIEP